jgi:hypothetical protein
MPTILIVLLHALLFLVLAWVPAWAQTTYHTRQQAQTRQGRTLPAGSDSYTCQQATSPQTPKGSVNGGISCLAGGDTLLIGPGTYNEIVVTYYSQATCLSGDAAVQQPCAVIPNGLDPDRPTRLLGTGQAVISPRGKASPGGGGILTAYDQSRALHIEGLRFVADNTPGSAVGVHLGHSQYVTVTRSEIAGNSLQSTGALLASSGQSRYHTLTHNEVHHAGQQCNPRTQTSPPCPHGLYIQGQDHLIADNYVHHNTGYGVQVSGESGGLARVVVTRNRVAYNQGVGIRVQGSDHQATANLLVANGLGMTITGTALIAHNTFDGVHPETAYDDPFGLWVDGTGSTIVNNLFTRQQSAWLLMQRRDGSTFVPVDPAWAHHNGADVSGNVGATIVHPLDTWYRDAASGDYTLPSTSPAIAAGVTGTGVDVDLVHHAYQTPDLGSYAASPQVPPTPTPPGAMVCRGELGAKGMIELLCSPQEGRR